MYDFSGEHYITMVSKQGLIKRTKIDEFKVLRYSKPMTCMKLKDGDSLVAVLDSFKQEIFIATHLGYGLRFIISEVAPTGIKSAGIKAITLKDDEVVSANMFDEHDEFISVITCKNNGKRVRISEFERMSRARKGTLLIRDVKTNPYYILKTFIVGNNTFLSLKIGGDYKNIKITELPILDRYSTGTGLTKANIKMVFEETKVKEESEPVIIKQDDINSNEEELSLKSIDEKIMTIDDFLDDFEFDE